MVSENLRTIRRSKRMRQFDIARALGVTEHTISRIETERLVPDAVMLQRLADVLGVPVEALTAGEREVNFA